MRGLLQQRIALDRRDPARTVAGIAELRAARSRPGTRPRPGKVTTQGATAGRLSAPSESRRATRDAGRSRAAHTRGAPKIDGRPRPAMGRPGDDLRLHDPSALLRKPG